MKAYTFEDLSALTPEDRATLYQNAIKHRDKGGQAIVDLIDQSGLPLSSGGIRNTDPAYIRMEEIIWSETGRKAAVDATEKGLPALAGTDPLISAELGDRYVPYDGGTVGAGYIQAALMRHLGYVENSQGKMPEGCVAKTAMKWKKR